ncbi:MAG: OmpA family protein [Chitinophagaceae bacterium]|nr:OmpA family protein [Chitinophagaceae bacterium]
MRSLLSAALLLITLAGHPQLSVTVHFDFNKYELTDAARARLDSFVIAEKQDSVAKVILLNGHCDAIGSNIYNDKLSKKRVSVVKEYLTKNGLANIGEEKGHGKREPLNRNRNEEERQLNRRVEISFVFTTSLPVPKVLKDILAGSAITSGSNIILRNINFVGGMHQFLPESQPMLEELLDAMKTYPDLVIRVEGHICCENGPQDGTDQETGIRNLSEARAKAVRDHLIENGIEATRVNYKGFGHSAPLFPYPEKSSEEMKLNRRVEIKIISK